MSALYHYTCDHHYPQIMESGVLRPGLDGLVWLTDLHPAPRLALGLTSYILDCDRMAHVIRLDRSEAVWWMDFRRTPRGRELREKETAPGVLPMHWWVSTVPIPVPLSIGGAP